MNLQKLQYLDSLFEKEIEEGRIGGASLVVCHKGREVFRNVYGSDKEDSIYKVFSMTKPITTVAAMMLYEQGLIDLYEPISKYLEGYKEMKVATKDGLVDAVRPITLQHLLNMTSGLVYPGEDRESDRVMEQVRIRLHERAVKAREEGRSLGNLDIINTIGQEVPLQFQPGEGWRYGFSADALAGVVEVVTGIPYGEHLKKVIFDPLGMKDTGFYVEESQIHRLAQMYSRVDEEGHLKKADEQAYEWLNMYAPTKPPYIESGGGGLYSTLEDYNHFVQMLAAGGTYQGKNYIGRKTVDYISGNQLNEQQMKYVDFDSIIGYGYGNYMRVMMNPALAASNGSVGEYGWDGLPGTYFFIDPKEELTLVYMQQIEQGADQCLRRKMRQIIYGALD